MNEFLKDALIILPVIGGMLSAWHGGQIHGGDPKAVKNIAWLLPNLIVAFLVVPSKWMTAFVLLDYLKTVAHGRGFRLKEPMKIGSTRDSVEYLIAWLEGRIPLYWYKVLIMSLSGGAAVIGSALSYGMFNPAAGLIVLLGGLLKGVNAMLFDERTMTREFADGVVAKTFFVIATYMVL